jgi:large subunit ribosomal protein L23
MIRQRLLQVLRSPHVSEKATVVCDADNQYVFKVAKDATKLEIKQAVEGLFKVSVLNVNLLMLKWLKDKKSNFSMLCSPIDRPFVSDK